MRTRVVIEIEHQDGSEELIEDFANELDLLANQAAADTGLLEVAMVRDSKIEHDLTAVAGLN